jgi:hypothetical protein
MTASVTQTDLQKINVKFGIQCPDDTNWDALLAVFGRWRLEEGEEIIDLADYAHVPEGPSVILVSKRWQFGVDFARGSGLGRDGGWGGLFLSSRKGLSGDTASRIGGAARSCLEKSKRLLGERETPDGIELLCAELDVVFNDRVLVPNTDESDATMLPSVQSVATSLYGDGGYEIERDADPDRRLGYAIRASSAIDVDAALARLGAG